jgi:hypothetical protein
MTMNRPPAVKACGPTKVSLRPVNDWQKTAARRVANAPTARVLHCEKAELDGPRPAVLRFPKHETPGANRE